VFFLLNKFRKQKMSFFSYPLKGNVELVGFDFVVKAVCNAK